jgi:hypothetical protein
MQSSHQIEAMDLHGPDADAQDPRDFDSVLTVCD